MERFVYVSSDVIANELIKKGFSFLKYDHENHIYIFNNSNTINFDFSKDKYKGNVVFSNVLTF